MPEQFTVGQVAKMYGLPRWKLMRLFEHGHLPEPKRCGPFRMLTPSDLPEIERVLRERGYIATATKAEERPALQS
jgi:hypothetical protein